MEGNVREIEGDQWRVKVVMIVMSETHFVLPYIDIFLSIPAYIGEANVFPYCVTQII